MFVSVKESIETGKVLGYEILSDDGHVVMDAVTTRQYAMFCLKSLWMARAKRHGLTLGSDDMVYGDNTFTVDGMDPDEWIMAVCGCGEDGGTLTCCTADEV